jgi:thiamine-phosphate pyrophosphorylase
VTVSPAGVLARRRLYLCTADRPDLEDFLDACLRGGVDMVQLRDKSLEARPLIARARAALRICRDHDALFVVNDRPDIALEVGADGVHVGQDDVPPALARRIVSTEAIVGLSTHAPTELVTSIAEPVDYVSAGPIEPTPTKPGRPGTGPGYIEEAARRAGRPVFVTGGVRPETVPAFVGAGARRFVVVRYLTEAADPEQAARTLSSAIDEALASAAEA